MEKVVSISALCLSVAQASALPATDPKGQTYSQNIGSSV